ncbi:hypothetical protein [Paludibaculum fermentans]|uniref:Glycerophosphoryl diester phosphodiesterase membrane domain-containing protein n=1 Tax=Paludibaculum fermentans TaxID=1473598 RepID=A0A7S7NWD6_PALFE|nr:hypothetical protein [Paludibaculum fermentans]QOY91022.1 hypothetical protein IRI77_14080 [Paludibaculum fermentans]
MTVFQAIRGAAGRVSLRKRMMVGYWFFHTMMAAFVAVPLMGVAISNLGHSRYGAELMRGFDISWLLEVYFYLQGGPIGAIVPTVVLAVLLLFLGSIFLAGGAVKMLVYDGPDYSPRMFYEGCGRYFWRFLRLALYSIFFYAIAILVSRLLRKLVEKAWGEGMEDHQATIAGWVVSGFVLLLYALVSTAMDYAKVRLVVDDSRKSLRAAFGSMRLVLTHLGKTMGVWLVLTVLLALFAGLYLPVSNWLQGGGAAKILTLIVLQQLYVFSRVWLRMMAWGSAAELDPFVRPKPLPPPEPVYVPVAVEPEPPEFSAGAEAEPEV